jgi:meso-butanediol dehydrogenase/(S,S)-butanediol dehydrogenase/diacetyl reductase
MLDGRVALVSAAASGIGAAVARRFAAEGAVVCCNDVAADALRALVDELVADGARAEAHTGDASDPNVVADWVESVSAAHGHIDVLSNNVGESRPALVADINDDDWHAVLRLTLDSVFLATRAVLPHLVAGGGGSIVSMASGAGVIGGPGLGAYGPAKAGVVNLMQTVATEYGHLGVRANAVTPGPTATAPLLAHLRALPGGGDAARHAMEADLALGRLSHPDEVAATVTWLASDQASNITGICLRSNVKAAGRRRAEPHPTTSARPDTITPPTAETEPT